MCLSDACITRFLFIIKKKKKQKQKLSTSLSFRLLERAQWGHCYMICIEIVQIKCHAFNYF